MDKSRIGAGRSRRSRTLGYIGVFGSLLAVGADIALGYNSEGVGVFDTLFSFSVMQVYPLFMDTPHWRLLLSNYLAIAGIPLGFLGLLFVHRQLISGNSIWDVTPPRSRRHRLPGGDGVPRLPVLHRHPPAI